MQCEFCSGIGITPARFWWWGKRTCSLLEPEKPCAACKPAEYEKWRLEYWNNKGATIGVRVGGDRGLRV